MTKLYQEVSLNCDFPEYNLKQGDLAILVDTVPHPTGGEEGYVLEIFDAEGESIDVVIVPKSAIVTEKIPSPQTYTANQNFPHSRIHKSTS